MKDMTHEQLIRATYVVAKFKDPETAKLLPYLQGPGRTHFCCRSTETLITKSWRELGIDADDMDEGTRASMDGQIPADTSYLDWLARQSPQRQDQILGPERGRMYRSGKLELGNMFTDKGEWITLSQLHDRSKHDLLIR